MDSTPKNEVDEPFKNLMSGNIPSSLMASYMKLDRPAVMRKIKETVNQSRLNFDQQKLLEAQFIKQYDEVLIKKNKAAQNLEPNQEDQ